MSAIQDKLRRVNPIVILVILMVVSMVGRIVYVALFVDDNRWYWEDTIHYYSAAESLVTEGTFGFDPERPEKRLPYGLEPLYPLFMAPLPWCSARASPLFALFRACSSSWPRCRSTR